jgi:hypothetical protein
MPDPADRLVTGRLRLLQYIGDAGMLFACVVFALLIGKNWAWGPFLLAPVIVAVAPAASAMLLRYGKTKLRPTDADWQRAIARRRQWMTITVPAYVTFAVGVGLVAGSIPSYWPDVVLGVLIMLFTILLPLALLPVLLRRARSQRTAHPGAVE